MWQNVTMTTTNGGENANNLGKEIIIRQNGKEEKGRFVGIDEYAALLMETSQGVKKILAGDVFFEETN